MKDSRRLNRRADITLARVLGMVFIVLCHIVQYYKFLPGSEFLGQFFNCGVQLFLFVSGYLSGNKTIKNFKTWYLKRAVTVSLPAIIISVFTILALLCIGEQVSIASIIAYLLDLEGLLFVNWNFFVGIFNEIPSLGPLWFTTIIMLCYLLVPMLQKATRKIKNNKVFLLLFIVLGCVLTVLLSDIVSISYFLCFGLGYFIGKDKWLDRVDVKAFIVYTFMFFASLAGRLILHKYFDGTKLYTEYASISHIVLGTWFVVLFAYLNNAFNNFTSKLASSKAIEICDEYSFFIYLVHGIFCMGTFNVFEHFSTALATFLFVICTIVISVALKWVCGKISVAINKKLT